MKIHLVVIIALASLLFVPSCLGKTTKQGPAIKKVNTVEKVNYKVSKVTTTPKAKPEQTKLVSLPEFEQQIINLLNAERAKRGIKTLKVNQKLVNAAQARAQDINSLGYWSHESPEGKHINDFIRTAGYRYEKVGENLAQGYKTPEGTVAAWLNSPTHKSNMLDPEFLEVGIAKAQDTTVLVLAKEFIWE